MFIRPPVYNQTPCSHMNWSDVNKGRCDKRNDMTFKVIQGPGHRAFKLRFWKSPFSKSNSIAVSVSRLNLIIAYDIMGQYLNSVESDYWIFAPFTGHMAPKITFSAMFEATVAHGSDFRALTNVFVWNIGSDHLSFSWLCLLDSSKYDPTPARGEFFCIELCCSVSDILRTGVVLL